MPCSYKVTDIFAVNGGILKRLQAIGIASLAVTMSNPTILWVVEKGPNGVAGIKMVNGNHNMFTCTHCDAQFEKWEGRCRECGQWGTVQESGAHITAKKLGNTLRTFSIDEANANKKKVRVLIGWPALDEVWGGGLTAGSVTLIAGEPGIGKSTLALQIARYFNGSLLYISGEENEGQVAERAVRLGLGAGKGLHVVSAQSVNDIVHLIETMEPDVVVVDSIQTIVADDNEGVAGSVSQVKAAAAHLVTVAKKTEIPIIIIGHVTKEGAIAGPKTLEHLVDTVCQFESDMSGAYRLLKVLKHRFGPTDTVAVWELRAEGLVAVSAVETVFLPPAPAKSARVIGTVVEGSRAFLVEVQALVTPTAMQYPERTVTGFDAARLKMLIAVAQRYGDVSFRDDDIFVNIVGGWKGDDTSLDTAVLAALILAKKKNSNDTTTYVAIGEIGLDGYVRTGSHTSARLKAAMKVNGARILIASNPDKESFSDIIITASCADIVKKLLFPIPNDDAARA